VAGAEKAQLLARATALLAPIQWEEPFGLAVVEAMASGTPAVVMRRGAAEELVIEGITGFCADSVDGMVAAVSDTPHLDPWRVASATRRRFSPAAMAAGYLRAYEEVVSGVPVPLAAWRVMARASHGVAERLTAAE
jgi:glycosyltransferase involved in cell wall biosynthesis